MSGPKVDKAELDRMKRAELERIRLERQQRIKRETDKLNKAILSIDKSIELIRGHHLLSGSTQTECADSIVQEHIDLKMSSIAVLSDSKNIAIPTEPHEISLLADKLTDETMRISSDFHTKAEYLSKIAETKRKHDSIIKEIEKEREAKDNSGIEVEDFTETINDIRSELDNLLNADSLQDEDREFLVGIMNGLMENDAPKKARISEYRLAKASVLRNMEMFDESYRSYYAEYILWRSLLEENGIQPEKMPDEKIYFSSADEIEEERRYIAESSRVVMEREYINRQIHDVMREFGYNMVNDLVFGANRKGQHLLCINETGETAIHMHLSDENDQKRMVMEIVGVDNKGEIDYDQIADSSQLNDDERSRLLFEQERFCELHPKIITALNERGIVFSSPERSEPALEHCKSIIRATTSKETVLVNDAVGSQEKRRKTRHSKRRRETTQRSATL